MTGDEGAARGIPNATLGRAGWPDPACPWVGGGNDDAWTKPVDEAPWQSRPIGDEVDKYKALGCPRCGHNMVVFVAAGAYRDAEGNGVAATCNCVDDHKGRPANGKGCGYGAWIARPGGTQ
jgi:hypothetical protein